MKSKGKGIFHIGSRLWWVFICFLGLLFLAGSYNYTYLHSSKSTQKTMNAQREWFLDRIPNYHPKKNTNGTKKAQNAENKLKEKIRDRD